jgi:FkbM family methyltransferase
MGLRLRLLKIDILNRVAVKFFPKLTLQQSFHGGVIYMNARQHKWVWNEGLKFETFDSNLQDIILKTSKGYDLFIDIGCNIGVMTIGTLLYNKDIKAISVDASRTAINLLNRSLRANKLTDRCSAICAAIGSENGTTNFNDNFASLIAHIDTTGSEIDQVKLSSLLNNYNHQKTLVKIDTEGYEAIILSDLKNVKNLNNMTFLVEIHDENMNGFGDPTKVFEYLKENKGVVRDMEGNILTNVRSDEITQVFVTFN